MLTVRSFDAEGTGLGYERLSEIFIESYSKRPWSEFNYCPQCKGIDDFGPYASFGEEDGKTLCPMCGTNLIPFWSIDRVRKYIEIARANEGFDGFLVYNNGDLVSFYWGYEHTPVELQSMFDGKKCFYLDVVWVDRKLRFVKTLISILDTMKDFISKVKSSGYEIYTMRTHREALGVQKIALKYYNFVPTNITSNDDTNRLFWVVYL